MAKTKTRKARKRVAVRASAPSRAEKREALRSRANENNVDTSAPPPDRAAQMLSLLEVTSDLDAAQSASFRNNVTRFLLHVSWHEGARLARREQMQGGPARSFFQFEMGRAKDAGDFAIEKGLVGKLAAVSGRSEPELRAEMKKVTGGDPGTLKKLFTREANEFDAVV